MHRRGGQRAFKAEEPIANPYFGIHQYDTDAESSASQTTNAQP